MLPLILTICSLGYPGSVRWLHILAPHIRLVHLYSANVATRVPLPQNRVEMLIGSQANYKI